MMIKIRILVTMVAALLAFSAMAGELAGVSMPDELDLDGKKLVLNGLGLREASMLKVDVYVAGLYLEQKSSDADAVIASEQYKSIQMVFVRKVKKKSIIKAWDEGFEKNGGADAEALAERVATLNSYMTDFAKGDTMGFTYRPNLGVFVQVNAEPKGQIEGADFARVLLSIWLGPEPPNPGIKEGMLGLE
jgi:hypothetical protein